MRGLECWWALVRPILKAFAVSGVIFSSSTDFLSCPSAFPARRDQFRTSAHDTTLDITRSDGRPKGCSRRQRHRLRRHGHRASGARPAQEVRQRSAPWGTGSRPLRPPGVYPRNCSQRGVQTPMNWPFFTPSFVGIAAGF